MILLLLLTWLACTPAESPPADPHAGHAHAQDLHTCPMHPDILQQGPGACPICGMDLVPASGPGETSAAEGVHIAPHVVQNMGVRTAVVAPTTVFRHLRTLGQVEVGEDELEVVNLRTSGWVERIYVERTGDPVKRGQKLFELYSPELVAAQEELLLALRTQGADSELARSARRRLELWEVSKTDIDRIAARGEVERTVTVRSPADGFVLHKDVVDGARVQAGQDLYRIGNLTSIWVTAEVYEFDAPWVEVGQPAQMSLAYQPERVLEGEVAYIYPTVDPVSRTLKVRLEFENPGVRLKPGMFATVDIQYRRKDDVLAVPAEAILHSGERELVFVEVEEGTFAPRQVQSGLSGDHRMVEISEGLSAGEVIVLSGQFLIDSESQLQEAIAKMMNGVQSASTPAHQDGLFSCPMHPEVLSEESGRCPDCGMFLEERPGTAAEHAQLQGHAAPPQAQPGQYTCPMHPAVISDTPGRCPSCNMFLEQVPGAGDE